MDSLKKNKNAVIVIGVIIVLALVGFLVTRGGGSSSDTDADKDSVLPNVEAIPTVDPSVEVSLEADALKQEVTLTIENYPEGTELVEYELTYDSYPDGQDEAKTEGLIGTIEIEKGLLSKSITLGTCSRGVCRYHEGVEAVDVVLKFQGDYGAQLFKGSFEI